MSNHDFSYGHKFSATSVQLALTIFSETLAETLKICELSPDEVVLCHLKTRFEETLEKLDLSQTTKKDLEVLKNLPVKLCENSYKDSVKN